jgi:hypothetical protein
MYSMKRFVLGGQSRRDALTFKGLQFAFFFLLDTFTNYLKSVRAAISFLHAARCPSTSGMGKGAVRSPQRSGLVSRPSKRLLQSGFDGTGNSSEFSEKPAPSLYLTSGNTAALVEAPPFAELSAGTFPLAERFLCIN